MTMIDNKIRFDTLSHTFVWLDGWRPLTTDECEAYGLDPSLRTVPTVTITVVMTLPLVNVQAWASEQDLTESVEATLHEVNADDGQVYVPTMQSVTITR